MTSDDTMAMDEHPDEETWVRFACDELAAGERVRLVDHAFALRRLRGDAARGHARSARRGSH